jgi:hypothetical protein
VQDRKDMHALQPGDKISNLEHAQHKLEGDRNATVLDYCGHNDSVRHFIGDRSS